MINRFFLSKEKYLKVAFYIVRIRIILFMYDIASGEEGLVITTYSVILKLNISMNV